VISSKTEFQGDVSLYQISAPIQPGNSGGPLFDSRGNVIGIISAKHRGAENVGYAIKTSYLRNLVESVLTTTVLPKTNKVAGLNLSGKVKSLKNYVYYIACSRTENNNSTYSSGIVSGKSEKLFLNPTVTRSMSNNIRIMSVKLSNSYTAVKMRCENINYNGWCNINKNTYIVANGIQYTMTKADGIKESPETTKFSYKGQELFFTLYFPTIPTNAISIDLIEPGSSDWKVYGISLK